MYTYKNILSVLLIYVLLLSTGCQDYAGKCYYCYALNGTFKAVKGVDTIVFYSNTKPHITDFISHYLNLGYSVDTLEFLMLPYPSYGDKTCGIKPNNNSMPQIDSCVNII